MRHECVGIQIGEEVELPIFVSRGQCVRRVSFVWTLKERVGARN